MLNIGSEHITIPQ